MPKDLRQEGAKQMNRIRGFTLLTEVAASTEPLLEDNGSNHGAAGKNVLYVGGHVKWMSAE